MARRIRSISLTILLGGVTTALSIALLVGWIVVILQNSALTRKVAQNTWLLLAGTISLGVIMTVLVLFSVFLVRETLEIRRQDSFIDSVTHELKSPLASLKLCLETVERPEIQIVQRQALRQMMLDDVERLSAFIDDVLEASRLAHSRQGHTLSEVLIPQVIDHCADNVCKRYRLLPSHIVREMPADLRMITDRTALETILKNLLDNAVKYSDPPAHVRVTITRLVNDVLFEVEDHGIGISAQHLKRVFERFYRIPHEAVRRRRGTGLGLFVVSSLVRSLGGRLAAQSHGDGCGTRMRVWLPVGRAGRSHVKERLS